MATEDPVISALFMDRGPPLGNSLGPSSRRRLHVFLDQSETVPVDPGPIQFRRDGSTQEVIEDTVTPANNRPLPVKLTSFAGDISITATNLNLDVQLEHTGLNPDSVQIGDGTEILLITTRGEATVSDLPQFILTILQNSNFIKLGNFDQVIPFYSGSLITLKYYESLAQIAQVEIDYVSQTNWSIDLFAYLNNDDGNILTDDFDVALLME